MLLTVKDILTIAMMVWAIRFGIPALMAMDKKIQQLESANEWLEKNVGVNEF